MLGDAFHSFNRTFRKSFKEIRNCRILRKANHSMEQKFPVRKLRKFRYTSRFFPFPEISENAAPFFAENFQKFKLEFFIELKAPYVFAPLLLSQFQVTPDILKNTISELPGSRFKTSLCKSFDLHENEPAVGTHFHMNGFARRLVLTQRQRELGSRLFSVVENY